MRQITTLFPSILTAILLVFAFANADIIHVPDDFKTIQRAIDDDIITLRGPNHDTV